MSSTLLFVGFAVVAGCGGSDSGALYNQGGGYGTGGKSGGGGSGGASASGGTSPGGGSGGIATGGAGAGGVGAAGAGGVGAAGGGGVGAAGAGGLGGVGGSMGGAGGTAASGGVGGVGAFGGSGGFGGTGGAPAGSCVGNCGYQSPGGCWCDNLCTGNGDCCSDFQSACGGVGGAGGGGAGGGGGTGGSCSNPTQCQTSSSCCDGFYCSFNQGYVCVPCLSHGSTCFFNSMCCSKSCIGAGSGTPGSCN